MQYLKYFDHNQVLSHIYLLEHDIVQGLCAHKPNDNIPH